MARQAPKHLKPPTAAWWRHVIGEYELEQHHERILTLAAEAWDRAQEAREVIAEEGAYVDDRFGQRKTHPAVTVERDARIGFARLIRELDLDGEPGPDPRMPRRSG